MAALYEIILQEFGKRAIHKFRLIITDNLKPNLVCDLIR